MKDKKLLVGKLSIVCAALFISVISYGLRYHAYAATPQTSTPAQEVAQASAPQEPAKPDTEENIAERLASQGNVTLDFKDADIRNVLKIISYKSGINIVTTPEVIGNITIRLMDVPWEKALDVILKTYGFGYEWQGDKVIIVSTLEKLAQQRKSQQEASEMEPIDTGTFVLNFSKVDDIRTSVEKLISPRGRISLESRTNTLIITDSKTNLVKIAEVIKRLDKITPQVMIEVKIIETTLGSTESLGIDWNTIIKASGSKRPTTWPWTSELKGTGIKMFPKVAAPSELERVTDYTYNDAGTVIGSSTSEKTWNRLVPGFPAVSADAFTFGTLDMTSFSVVLEMLSARANTKIVSNPRITTLNNQEAKILVGRIVPIAKYEYSKDSGTQVISGYEDKEVGVRLTVTPNVNEQDYITLNINPAVDEIIGSTGPNGERPIISTRSAETKVMVRDNQTLIIGGLISENKTKSRHGLPILGDLPILSLIFGKKEDTVTKTEMIIFVTPHIIRDGMTSPEEIAKLDKGLSNSVKKDSLRNKKK